MRRERIEAIARAVLYEGYLLYPYRGSALKNRYRWSFGVLYPEAFDAVREGSEASRLQAECLFAGSLQSRIDVSLRFLQLVRREAGRGGESCEHEAVEREVTTPVIEASRVVHAPLRFSFRVPVARGNQQALEGAIEVAAAEVSNGAFRLTVRVRNLTKPAPEIPRRDEALMGALVSAHVILHVERGEFVSMTDPPAELREAAAACRNAGAWPVLVGDEAERGWMLCAPIVLYDYPQVAPESAGDYFDGTKIDELLALRVLTLTEEEKREVREGDPRAREILRRTESLPSERLLKLHGALRRTEGEDR